MNSDSVWLAGSVPSTPAPRTLLQVTRICSGLVQTFITFLFFFFFFSCVMLWVHADKRNSPPLGWKFKPRWRERSPTDWWNSQWNKGHEQPWSATVLISSPNGWAVLMNHQVASWITCPGYGIARAEYLLLTLRSFLRVSKMNTRQGTQVLSSNLD